LIIWKNYWKKRRRINEVNDKIIDKEIQELMGDDIFTDEELGININDYLDESGYFKDYHGYEYHKDRDYLTFKKFYKNMKPTKEDFDILRSYYNTDSFVKKDYDYSFVKSQSLRYLLFDEPMPQSGKDDKYFSLLDIEIRKIVEKLITLLNKTEDYELRKDILAKINKIKNTDYIFTKKENDETFIPLLLYENNR
jgi:hypothetical protein